MELEIAAPTSQIADFDDERALVERARSDRAAFATLYRLHSPAIARYILRRTGDPHVAEDLVSEVFLAALKGLPRFRHRDIPIRSWLYRIATNGVNRWAKRHRRQALREWSAAIEAHATRLHSAADGGSMNPGGPSAPDESALTGESARSAMLTLPPKHQSVLALHYLEGLSIVEIAAALGCREGTVKSRLARGRDALRERLEQGRLAP